MSGTALRCLLASFIIVISSLRATAGLPASITSHLHRGDGLKAHNVTFTELSLCDGLGGRHPRKECMFVAALLHSTRAGWAVALHQEGTHGHYYLGGGEGDPPSEAHAMESLMSAAMRLLEGRFLVPATFSGQEPVQVQLNEGLVEAWVTHPAPHDPLWVVRMQDRPTGHVLELRLRPQSVGELPVSEENHLLALREQRTGVSFDTAGSGVGLCRWTQLVSSPAQLRSKRQATEVVVINRRKKHHDGNGAAVAIGLGVGLGVGIPVVVLLALVPCVIALWLIMRKRRRTLCCP